MAARWPNRRIPRRAGGCAARNALCPAAGLPNDDCGLGVGMAHAQKHGWAKEIRFSAPATGKRHCYRSRMNNGGSKAKPAPFAAGWRMRGAECALSCGRHSERRLRSWRWHGARPKHGWAKEIRFSAPATGKRHCYRSRMNNGGSMAKSAHSTAKRIYAPDCRAHIRAGTIARIIRHAA